VPRRLRRGSESETARRYRRPLWSAGLSRLSLCVSAFAASIGAADQDFKQNLEAMVCVHVAAHGRGAD
jgi:hypothetical protein